MVGNPYQETQCLHLHGTNNNLMECSWSMAERRSVGWETDSKAERYESEKTDALMWATVPNQQCMQTFPQEASCCQWDGVTMGANEGTRPTDSAKTGVVCGNAKLNPEVMWSWNILTKRQHRTTPPMT